MTTALHLSMQGYTLPRRHAYSAHSTPLLLHPPTHRDAIAAGNAPDLASSLRHATYKTGRLTHNDCTAGVTQSYFAHLTSFTTPTRA
jgi:hypothetical protein